MYISCRHGERGPTEERQALTQSLEKFGIKVSAIDTESEYNEVIESNLCRDITSAKLIILLVTEEYASATSTDNPSAVTNGQLTSRDELEFVIEAQRPFFLLKLCRLMPTSTAKLPITSSYASWTRGKPIPHGLIETLLKKIDSK